MWNGLIVILLTLKPKLSAKPKANTNNLDERPEIKIEHIAAITLFNYS